MNAIAARDRKPIEVMRPRLPSAAWLLSYLRRIDVSRTYTNWGPLASELECGCPRISDSRRAVRRCLLQL